MFFGKSTYRKPQPGLQLSSKRQLVKFACLLFLILAISYGYWLSTGPEKRGVETLIPGGGESALGSFGLDLRGDEQKLKVSVAPETFREQSEILTQAAAQDRTSNLDEAALTYLLQKIRVEGENFYEVMPALSHARGDKVWSELLAYPDKYRGKLVEAKGNIVSRDRGLLPLNLRGLDTPNPSGLGRAFESYLLGVDGKFFLVATLRKQRELEHLDGVHLRGYFCQLYTGDVEFPDGTQGKGTIPFLVCDDYELLERPLVDPPSFIPLVFLVAVGVCTVAVVMVISRRSRSHYETRRLGAKRRTGS